MDLKRTASYLIHRGEDDVEALTDALSALKALEVEGAVYEKTGNWHNGEKAIYNQDNFDMAHSLSADFRHAAKMLMKKGGIGFDAALELYYKGHLFDAPYSFDSFCIYLEKNREKKKKFYLPRRKQLLPIVYSLQDLADDKLDILGISLPPGVGKSTLALFYCAWFGGRDSEKTILTASHSNSLVRGMYGEMLRLLSGSGGDYLFSDVFPASPLVGTSSKDMQIDLLRRKRFSTYQYTSLGSANAGRLRASGLLYVDDLVPGIETAMSKDRLDKIWSQFNTDLRQREIGNAKELVIGTRWSIYDHIGRLEEMHEGNDRAKFIRFSALDEVTDESNFDYPYNLGFTTEYYRETREMMDTASWKAVFENSPIERFGVLYDPSELRYYFDLPERDPDSIISVLDVADGGGDYWAMPILYQYGNDYYVVDFLCDNGKPDIVEDRVVDKLICHKVNMCRIESNRGAGRVAESIQKKIKERGGITRITTKYTTSQKESRIIVSSGYVKQNFLFRDKSTYQSSDKEYRTAMNFMYGYTMSGRNKHDDVCDSLSLTVDFISSFMANVVETMKRPF